MFCAHCGAENDDDALNCIKCGEPLRSDNGQEAEENSRQKMEDISFAEKESMEGEEAKGTSNCVSDDTQVLSEMKAGTSSRIRKISVDDSDDSVSDFEQKSATVDLSNLHLEDVSAEGEESEEFSRTQELSKNSSASSSAKEEEDGNIKSKLGHLRNKNVWPWILFWVVIALLVIALFVLIFL